MGTRDADFDQHQRPVTTSAAAWISNVSRLLQLRWPSIDPARLDDVAADLWNLEHLRSLDAETAARLWLEPVNTRPPARHTVD